MLSLIDHFETCTDDLPTTIKWARRASELGNIDAQKSLVSLLSRTGSELDLEEARQLAATWGLEKYLLR
jgi:hypothetical protein